MVLEWDARPGETGPGGTGAAPTLGQPSCLRHSLVLTLRRLDGLAGVLDALGLPGTAAAIAGRLAQAGDEVVLRFGARAYAVRRARP
jgi:hypothetical protein